MNVTKLEEDKFTDVEGKYGPIMLSLKDILKPNESGKPVRCVVVEGAAGVGKTTLAWAVCHKWAEEKLDSVKQYELVILVQLRKKRAQNAHTIKDLLPFDRSIDIEQLVVAIGRGSGVLVICDGFNELPCVQRKSQLFQRLFTGRLLPEATIIVTSHPSTRASLLLLCHHNVDRYLKVRGFTVESIELFAESVFDSDTLDKFLSFISDNSSLYAFLSTPLNAVIIAFLFTHMYHSGASVSVPTTLTQLFDTFVCTLIKTHMISHDSSFVLPSSLQHIDNINMLPPSVGSNLLKLAELAYNGLRKNVFAFHDLGDDFEHLGIMKKISRSSNIMRGSYVTYLFFHVTLQRYLAALHISFVHCNDLPHSLGEHIIESYLFAEESDENAFEYFLKFILGRLKTCFVRDISVTSVSSQSFSIDFNGQSISAEGEVLLSSIFKNLPTSSKILLNNGSIEADTGGLFHLVDALQVNSRITEFHMTRFNLQCYSTSANAKSLEKLLQTNRTLTHLNLSDNDLFSDSGAQCIFTALRDNTTLVHLNLSNIGLTSMKETTDSLIEMLQRNKKLSHLDLSGNKSFSNLGVHSVFSGLQKNNTLSYLNVSDTGLTCDGVVSIDTLQNEHCSLQILDISMNDIGADGFMKIATFFQFYINLTKLHIKSDCYVKLKADEINRKRRLKGLVEIQFRFNSCNVLARLASAMDEYEKVSTTVIHCIPFGPPNVGKTCMKQRLMGKAISGRPAFMKDGKLCFPDDASSTGVADNVLKVCIQKCSQESAVQKASGEPWRPVKFQSELSIFLSKIIDSKPQADASVFQEDTSVQVTEDQAYTEGIVSEEGVQKQEVQVPTHSIKSSVLTSSPKQKAEVKHLKSPEHNMEKSTALPASLENVHPLNLFQKASDLDRLVKERLHNAITIHFTDAGGQPEFQEVLPMLVSGCSIFLLVFSLGTDINDKYEVKYFYEGKEWNKYYSSFTVKDVLLQCLAVVANIGTPGLHGDSVKSHSLCRSRVFLICTQTDLFEKEVAERKIKELNQELEEIFSNKNFLCLIERKTKDEIVFPISSYESESCSYGSESCFQQFRSKIDQVLSDEEQYKVTLPVPIFTLDLLLRQPKISQAQCDEAASQNGKTTNELEQFVLKHLKSVSDIDLTSPDMLKDMSILENAAEVISGCQLPKEELPLKKAILDLYELSQFREPIITIAQFETLATMCQIPRAQHKLTLRALHYLGTIRYYEDDEDGDGKVQQFVVNNPLFIYKVITKLIMNTNSRAHTDYHVLGFFKKEDLHKVFCDVSGDVQSKIKQETLDKYLTDILVHLYIIAPTKYDGREGYYYLPCVLKRAPSLSEGTDDSNNHLKCVCSSLLVSFNCGLTLSGIFSGIIAYFLHEEWILCPPNKTRPLEYYRDLARFCVKKYVYLTVTATTVNYLKFTLQVQEPDTCAAVEVSPCCIKEIITKGFKKVVSRSCYTFNVTNKFGYECRCDKDSHHRQFVEYGASIRVCPLGKNTCEPLDDYKIWGKQNWKYRIYRTI